jgi:hypothetical protein
MMFSSFGLVIGSWLAGRIFGTAKRTKV